MAKNCVLVTGGTGYIGSHTVVELLNKGFEVIVADNLSNSFESVLDAVEKITSKKVPFMKVDLTDAERVDSLFKSYSIDAVIHFAAYKSVGESVEKPLKYYGNNIASLVNILDACQIHGVNNFVFSSSCSVYGEPDTLPVTESNALKPAGSPYANTKQIGEVICRDVMRISEVKGIMLRYFNPVGSHESALIGELPIGRPNNLVPVITQTAIGKRPSLQVFGNDYDTVDGSCIRDYIHVVDIAKAHVIAIERLLRNKNKSKYEIFNLGTGQGNSVLEVIHTFERVTGVKVNYEIAPRRPGDVVKVYADTTFANEELGWKAKLNLEDMLSSAWKWEQALKNNNINE